MGLLSGTRQLGRRAFAGFVFVHFAFQAFRARGDAARPEPGLEAQPWFVAALLILVGAPFALWAAHELRNPPFVSPSQGGARKQSERALALAERGALVLVLSFMLVHCAQIVWPLFDGSALAVDVRPNLVSLLSSTSHGVPLEAALYVSGVGAGAFYATRQALAVLAHSAPTSRSLSRVLVALGVLGYVLGSYAVIRCAGGEILP